MRSYTINYYQETGELISSELCRGLSEAKREAWKGVARLVGPIRPFDHGRRMYRVLVFLTALMGGKRLVAMDFDVWNESKLGGYSPELGHYPPCEYVKWKNRKKKLLSRGGRWN